MTRPDIESATCRSHSERFTNWATVQVIFQLYHTILRDFHLFLSQRNKYLTHLLAAAFFFFFVYWLSNRCIWWVMAGNVSASLRRVTSNIGFLLVWKVGTKCRSLFTLTLVVTGTVPSICRLKFILNGNLDFWLTISYTKPFVFSVPVLCFQIFTAKLIAWS